MLNLTKLKFVALEILGKNYLSRILDAEIHLEVMNLGNTLKDGNQAFQQDHAKAMIFIRHHLHEELKNQVPYILKKKKYLTLKRLSTYGKNLKEKYENHKIVILPKTHYDWFHLKLQDLKVWMSTILHFLKSAYN